jgi:tRNA-dihydrouridine synthase C
MSWISPGKPAVVLAPMEGVTDSPVRALFSERGGFSFCVAEFLRISHELLPPKVYFEHIPELAHGCKTPAGTPVQIQLLGGNAELMAASALRAVELGARAIDINFGCPAPLVNRNDGGATLLKYPDRIREIVAAVRAAVPEAIPVSAKLRLGWDCTDAIFENAERAVEGGASWITIHARTKTQGYAPPVDWKTVGEIKRRLGVPVVANGDIWTRQDFLRCREETGCEHFMLGRGAMVDPTLAHFISAELGISTPVGPVEAPFGADASLWKPVLERFTVLSKPLARSSRYTECRIKQWLKMVHNRHSMSWFDGVKHAQNLEELMSCL